MPSCADRPSPRSLGAPLRALALALLLALAAVGGARAQDDGQSPPAVQWGAIVQQAQEVAQDPNADTESLELVRDRLLRMRSAAIDFENAAAGRLADVNARLQTLGPAPAEGASEAPEIAQRRTGINAELAAAQAPVLEAQDFQRRAEALIRDIDKIERGRFAAELRSQGPSPLWPSHWLDTLDALRDNIRARHQRVLATLANPEARDALLRRIPLDVLLACIGIAIAFVLRVRLSEWAESALAGATSGKTIALLVALRNFSRLIVPAVGAGLLFGALDPNAVIDPTAQTARFHLPNFVLMVIGASWLASSLFAPRLPSFRLVPVDDDLARRGAWLTLSLGLLVAAFQFVWRYVADFDLTPAEAATMIFPLFLIGGGLMWLTSRLLRQLRHGSLAVRGAQPGVERPGGLGTAILHIVERCTWVIAFLSPALAATGYLAAASYLLYSTILTLGLFGAVVVLFDLATKVIGAIGDRRGEAVRQLTNDGLVPVLVAALLGLAAVPLLALTWGARWSDISAVWFTLRDGVTLGGMRISFGMVVTFALVFGALFALSRLLQAVLRSTVLPRTRMDAGGKNAVLAGVGYAGFFIATITAVSSTGIDLSSLAFVAGALSVGIGFGLQNIVSNFVSGIILLVERPIKEGDWIEVGGFAGYVRGISVRSTEIETFDRASVILPNSDLVAGTVLNRTHSGMSGRIQVPVSVAMESDPRLVERVLIEIAETHPLVLPEPSPRVLLLETGPDALLFEIRCWLRDVNFSLSARSDINFEIIERLDAAGIRRQPLQREAHPPSQPPEAPPAAPAAQAERPPERS